jgi:two-component system cell cycle sensor histidine kinase PleC
LREIKTRLTENREAARVVAAALLSVTMVLAAVFVGSGFFDLKWTASGTAIAAAVSCLIGISASATAAHMRRRRLVLQSLQTLDGLFDGVAVFRRGGGLLAPPRGVLTGFECSTRRDLIENLLTRSDQVSSLSNDDADLMLAAVRDGRDAMIEIMLSDERTFQIGQQATEFGPVVIVANDISRRVWGERELRARERKYTELTEIASDWTWETDAEHTITSISDRFSELTGISEEEIVGKRIIEIADIRRAPVDIRELTRCMHDQDAFSDISMPMRLSGRNGRLWVRFAGRPRITADGRFLGFHGAAADITRERNAEKRAEQASLALNDAIESVSEGLALFDNDASFIMSNGRMANDFAPAAHMMRRGVKLEALMQELLKTGLLRIPDVSAKAAAATISSEVDAGRMHREFRTSNNRWFSVFLNRAADEGIVMVYSDITAHKNHEAELDAKIDELERAQSELVHQKEELSELATNLSTARNQAEAASRAKSEFLAAMSHELRTPLNAVIGFSEVMVGEGLGSLGNDKYREYSRDILSSGQHLLALINNILDLSKAESGKLELTPQAVDLDQIVETSARMACPRDRAAAMTIDIQPEARELIADQQKLKQILINLISNAIKFTPEGGKINLTAKRRDRWTDIRIEDEGIGMRPEDIPGALTAFKQIDSTLGRKFEGTGLGLPLAARFAELHGGKLSIDSQPGDGTTVTVSIPDQAPRAAVA